MTHRKMAEDCWRLIKALIEEASSEDERLNDAAAINLIEMACNAAAEAADPLSRCICDGGPQGEGMMSVPHEPHCPLAKEER